MQIRDKIVIRDKESAKIPLKDLVATLTWTSSIDLDLYAIYEDKTGKSGQVYYANRGKLKSYPFVELDHDAGIGDRGGDNEENMRISDLSGMSRIMIVANIFNKPNARFSKFGGKVSVKSSVGNKDFEVPLTAKEAGSWCVIALIDNRNAEPELHNVNRVFWNRPEFSELGSGGYDNSPSDQIVQENPGLLSKLGRFFGL